MNKVSPVSTAQGALDFSCVRDHQANAFGRVARRLQHADGCLAKVQLESIANGHVLEGRSRLRAHIDFRSRACGSSLMPGNEISVQVSFENVADGRAPLVGGLEVKLHIALRIDTTASPSEASM